MKNEDIDYEEYKGKTLTSLLIGNKYLVSIDNSLKSDKQFILSVIKSHYRGDIYKFLEDNLKEDIEIFKACLLRKENFSNVVFPKSIMENKPLLLDMLKHGDFYDSIKYFYKNDKDLLSIYLIHQGRNNLIGLGKRDFNHFSKNKPFLLEYLKNNPDCYQYINEKLKDDLDIIDSLLKKNPQFIKLLSKDLQNDKGFLLYAIDKYGCKLSNCYENSNKDTELINASVRKNGEELFKIKNLSPTVELIDIALETYPVLSELKPIFWSNVNLIVKCLTKSMKLKVSLDNELIYFIHEMLPKIKETDFALYRSYISNKEIIKIVIENKIDSIGSFPGWNNDLDLADMAFKISPVIEHLHESKLYDREYMLQLIQGNEILAAKLHSYTSFYMNDYEFLDIFLKLDSNLITKSSEGKSDKKIIEKLLSKTSFYDIKKIDTSLLSDKELSLKFIKKNVSNYTALPINLKQDIEIIDLMLKEKGYVYIISDSGFANDMEFNKKMILKDHNYFEHIKDNHQFKSNKEIIQTYLQSISKYQIENNEILETSFPLSLLLKYDIINDNPDNLKYFLLKKDLENKMPNKENIKTNKNKI